MAFTSKDNTVPAEGQVKLDCDTSRIGRPGAKRRVLIVGNSITRHGVCTDIGWPNDWGMAASAEERDYVHLLAAKIRDANVDAELMVRQCSDWERHFTEDGVLDRFRAQREFDPDVVIFRLSENVVTVKTEEDAERFRLAIERFVRYLAPHGSVLFTTGFWGESPRDDAIRAAAHTFGVQAVELGDLGRDDRYMAIGKFEHNGVAHHPGDLGMAAIAERIWEKLAPMLK